ncbi:MAG TPA: cupredoxin domain-containing protein [Casimicrobiaceae bacterium]|nr:cupredoxin domain-containing protein [Casimicrobiaceae bacterium]
MKQTLLVKLVLAFMLALATASLYAQEPQFRLVIQDHQFEPSELTIPAGKKVKLIIENKDATAEEFESHELNREKVVPAKGQVTVFVGPLKPGRYPFFGDFHKDTAKGVLIAQ